MAPTLEQANVRLDKDRLPSETKPSNNALFIKIYSAVWNICML